MESKAQKEYKQAQQLENSENLERALDIYENILAIYPTTKTAGQIKNLNKVKTLKQDSRSGFCLYSYTLNIKLTPFVLNFTRSLIS